MVVLFLAAGAYLTIQVLGLIGALTTTEGPADPADAAALAAAESKVDEIADDAGFRI
ncbi:MAG: hypothetical protein GWO04_04940, partial [Actinobacteria bacterium]|nr:hypothetical protein [Actinomycetota bacterium]